MARKKRIGKVRKGGGETFAATHQKEKFVFQNKTGGDVDDLHVTFDVDDVKTSDLGGFKKATTDGKVVKLEGYTVTPNRTTIPEFERDGAFRIVKWQWTLGGQPAGAEQDGPP